MAPHDVEDEESAGSDAHKVRKERVAWKRLLVVGVFVPCGLVIAMLFGLMVGVQSTRKFSTYRERQACNNIRDSVQQNGILQSSRAIAIGSSMSVQTEVLPFLMPEAETYAGIAAGVRFIAELDDAHYAKNPSVFWHPAVAHADREKYESYMSSVVGFNVSIQDSPYQGDPAFGWSQGSQSPERETYYPLTSIWGSALATPLIIETMIGSDAVETFRRTPPALSSRLFDERKPTAHPWYDASGLPIVNDGLIFTMPYCGLQGCHKDGASILGLVVHVTVADDWESLLPKNVELTAVGGDKFKSVDVTRYSAHVEAYESYLGLEIRCYYNQQSAFQIVAYLMYTAASFTQPRTWKGRTCAL